MATFHPFPRLPLEIRSCIWAMTVEPRVVDAHAERREEDKTTRLLSTTPVPGMLQACREARNQARDQKLYQQATFYDDVAPRYVWVNFDVDMISLGETGLEYVKHDVLRIRRLQFEREMSEVFFHWESKELVRFPNVAEFYVIVQGLKLDWHQAWDDFGWSCEKENLWFFIKDTGEWISSLELDEKEDERLAESCRLALEKAGINTEYT